MLAHLWTRNLTILVAALAILAVAAALEVRSERHVALAGCDANCPDLCLWKLSTGFRCPGCGMTRSVVALTHGDLAAGLRFHPLGAVVLLVIAAQIPYRGWNLWRLSRGHDVLKPRWMTAAAWSFFVALLTCWAIRP